MTYGLITCVAEEEAFEETLRHYIDMILSKPALQIQMGRKAYYHSDQWIMKRVWPTARKHWKLF